MENKRISGIIRYDFHKVSRYHTCENENLRIVETADNLIKSDIKSLPVSTVAITLVKGN